MNFTVLKDARVNMYTYACIYIYSYSSANLCLDAARKTCHSSSSVTRMSQI